jgi:hypothetical protein
MKYGFPFLCNPKFGWFNAREEHSLMRKTKPTAIIAGRDPKA